MQNVQRLQFQHPPQQEPMQRIIDKNIHNNNKPPRLTLPKKHINNIQINIFKNGTKTISKYTFYRFNISTYINIIYLCIKSTLNVIYT